jgi:ATP-dependent Clp protease ATP-binding subunit ClpA
MFERFTDRARRVIVFAQEEARLLNHDYIGTEHLLLGLIHDGEGVAAKALESLGISLQAVRREVEESIGQGQSAPTGHIPFTPRAKKVLELSLRDALQLGHNYIGTEHLLLGLLREGKGVAAQVLVKLGADLSRVRQQVIGLLSGYAGAVATAEQVGARVRLVRMTVPDDLREAEEQLAQLRQQKQQAIDAQDFEQAAALRDAENQLLRRLTKREQEWNAGGIWPQSSMKTTSCRVRSSACGSCCSDTGSTPTAGPRRLPEPTSSPDLPDRLELSRVGRDWPGRQPPRTRMSGHRIQACGRA